MTQTSTKSRIGSRTRYVGLWALGTAIYVGGLVAGYPLVAVAGFAVCGVGAVASLRTSDRVVFDERDRETIEAASANTVQVVGLGSAVVFPSMVVLNALGYVGWPRWLGYLGLFVAGLFALWAGFLALARFRP